MDSISLRKQEANELRKKGDFSNALPIYRTLWQETGDKFDGVGLLCCLRKLDLFDEALVLADELIIKFSDFNWCKLEVVWTYLQGKLEKLHEKSEISEVIQVAERIMKFEPEGVAKKKIVFRVLKFAKSVNRWDIVDKWVNKLRPEELSKEPIRDEKGREGWCDQSLWYNYKIKCLIDNGQGEQAKELVDKVINEFPRQQKFFLRFKAMAFTSKGNLQEARVIYKELSDRFQSDWWILHEYSRILRDIGEKEEAIKIMCKAASLSSGKIETKVTLFEDMGQIFKDMEKYEESQAHFALSKFIRSKKNWNLKESLLKIVSDLKKLINKDEPASLEDALKKCQQTWNSVSNISSEKSTRTIRKGLIGKVELGLKEKPFCFIESGQESFYCLKSELPVNITNGKEVIFDAKPSFDKKKNKESWRATQIRLKD